jgi:uncharacterized membrane protein
MDAYTIFKFLHVLCAIAWVGGGLTLLVNAILNIRDNGPSAALRASQMMGSLAMRWFLPASALTLVFGLCVAFFGNLWSEAWVIIGLIGFASTFLTGHFVLRVRAEKMGKLVAAGREDEAITEGLALLRVSKFDYAVILMVVADMVFKPGWTDFLILGAMAVVISVAGVAFLMPPVARGARLA